MSGIRLGWEGCGDGGDGEDGDDGTDGAARASPCVIPTAGGNLPAPWHLALELPAMVSRESGVSKVSGGKTEMTEQTVQTEMTEQPLTAPVSSRR